MSKPSKTKSAKKNTKSSMEEGILQKRERVLAQRLVNRKRPTFNDTEAKLGAVPTPAAAEEFKKARDEEYSKIAQKFANETVPSKMDVKIGPASKPQTIGDVANRGAQIEGNLLFKQEVISYPLNWWEAVKDRFLPFGLRVSFPIRYVTKTVWMRAPKPDLENNDLVKIWPLDKPGSLPQAMNR